jgi:hypothetical protein
LLIQVQSLAGCAAPCAGMAEGWRVVAGVLASNLLIFHWGWVPSWEINSERY